MEGEQQGENEREGRRECSSESVRGTEKGRREREQRGGPCERETSKKQDREGARKRERDTESTKNE